MICEENSINAMRYIDGEMADDERASFEEHLASCEPCRTMLDDMAALKEVTRSVKIADLPETVWETYWTRIYNRIERSVAWFMFILGSLIVVGYSIYRAITDPNISTISGLGAVLVIVGLAILFLSVLREKLAVNKVDKYISEVKR